MKSSTVLFGRFAAITVLGLGCSNSQSGSDEHLDGGNANRGGASSTSTASRGGGSTTAPSSGGTTSTSLAPKGGTSAANTTAATNGGAPNSGGTSVASSSASSSGGASTNTSGTGKGGLGGGGVTTATSATANRGGAGNSGSNGGAHTGGLSSATASNAGSSSGGRSASGSGSGGQVNGGNSSGGFAGATAGRSGDGTPGVRIVGRSMPGTKGTRFGWSGVSIQARFRGTQVTIELDDAGNQNEFAVMIDGAMKPNLVTASGKTKYALATGLTDAVHDLLVWRRTEAFYNPTEFIGLSDFGATGALLAPNPAPDRRIEIIGDSITCGYGNEGTPGCTGTKPENNYLAYGSVAARLLNADLHTIAWSGIGMYRNYDEPGPSAGAMPTKYDLAVPTVSNSTWDFNQFQPQVVVINLGTNDFSTRGDPGQPYIDAYVKFLKHVRSVHQSAYIVCLIPVTAATTDVNQAVSTIKDGGDTRIESFDANATTGGNGCDGHPDVAKDNAMGEKLAAELKRVMTW
ncbi:MAG TPA: SGNH/GDSL hydrolase family protein [Polyangiaceae bacterium]